MKQLEYAKGFWNPYVAGIALGLVLLLTFYLMGTGLGASGAVARNLRSNSSCSNPDSRRTKFLL